MMACICKTVCMLVCFLYVKRCFICKCECAVCAYLYILACVGASVYVFGFIWEDLFALSSGGGGMCVPVCESVCWLCLCIS
jgi:hypothetical protein